MHSLKLYPRGHSKEPDIKIPNINGKAGENLQCKELEALRQRFEQECQYKKLEDKMKKLGQELRKEKISR